MPPKSISTELDTFGTYPPDRGQFFEKSLASMIGARGANAWGPQPGTAFVGVASNLTPSISPSSSLTIPRPDSNLAGLQYFHSDGVLRADTSEGEMFWRPGVLGDEPDDSPPDRPPTFPADTGYGPWPCTQRVLAEALGLLGKSAYNHQYAVAVLLKAMLQCPAVISQIALAAEARGEGDKGCWFYIIGVLGHFNRFVAKESLGASNEAILRDAAASALEACEEFLKKHPGLGPALRGIAESTTEDGLKSAMEDLRTALDDAHAKD